MGIRVPITMEIDKDEQKILKGIGLDIGLFLRTSYLEDKTNREDLKYQQMFETNTAIKLVIDPKSDGLIVDANSAAVKFYGYTKKTLLTKKISDINTLSKKAVAEKMRQAREKRKRHFHFRHKLANGHVRDVEVHSGPFTVNNRTYLYSVIHDVTERVEAEKRLKEAEYHFKHMFQNLPGYGYRISKSGEILDVNKAAVKALGYPKKEIIGKQYSDFYTDESREKAILSFKKILKSTQLRNVELSIRNKRGQEKWVLLNIEKVVDKNQKLEYILALQRDISERKEAERDLAQTTDRLKLATKSANIGIWDWFIKEGITVWDDITCMHYGVDPDVRQVDYERWKSFIHPDDIDGILSDIDLALEGKQDFNTSYRIIRPDNVQRHLRVTAIVIRDIKGSAIRMIGTNWDITTRLETKLALEASEKKFRNIFRSMDNGYILTDVDGNIQLVNPATAKLLGYKSETELIGMSVEKDLYVHSEEIEELRELLGIQDRVSNFELTFKTKSGDQIFVESNIHLIRNEEGDPVSVEGLFQDITIRKEMEAALIESESNYRSIVDSIPDIVYTYSLKDGGVFYSRNVKKTLGYSSEHLLKSPFLWNQSIHPDHVAKVREAIDNAKKDIPFDIEYMIQDKNGEWKWLHDRCFQIETIDNEKIIRSIAIDITDRVESEQMLRKLSFAMEESPAMVVITNTKGIFEYVNERFTVTTGYTLEEVIGKSPSILKSGYHDKEYYESLWKKIISGHHWRGEFYNKKKDGSYYWDMTNIAPMKDTKGKITHFVAVKLEISEQKRISEALHESERSYRGLFNSTLDAIYIQDKDGTFIDINKTAEEMYGYKKEEFIGKTPSFLSAPKHNDMKALEAYIKKAFKGKPQIFEFWGKKKDGTIFPKEVQLIRGTYFGKDVIIAFARDITERKKSEEDLKISERKFRTIFETSKDAIYVLNGKQKIVDINDAGLMMFGIKRSALSTIKSEKLYVFKDQFNEFHSHLKKDGFVQNMQIDYHDHSGSVVHCLESAVVNRNQAGKEENIYGIIRDITELVEARDATRMALEKAQQADKVKTLFLANMSHEIRTPLNAILGFTELLKDTVGKKLDSDELEFFDVIRSSGNRLMNTVHEILDISQIEAGTIIAEMEEINLRPIIEDCVAENLQPAKDKGLYINMVFEIFDATVVADEHAISSSVSHLIENAIKYTHQGGITITLKEKDKKVFMDVKDTGIGISKEYQSKIFEIFSQESEGYTKQYQGVGLGMALTKRYLDMCEVDIGIDSKKGKGTTFILQFENVVSLETVGTEKIRKFTKKEKQITSNKDTSILVVEDDPSNQNLIGFYLKRHQYKIHFADSVSTAINQLNQHPVHLVLLDLSLKGKQHGLDLADIMKDTSEWKEIPIIVLSAHAFKADKQRCLDHGCDDFITKPVKQDNLIENIKKYI